MPNPLSSIISAVLFDHDDTLVGTIGTKWAQHKFIAKAYYGRQLTDKDISKHWGKPLEELLCQLYGTDDVDQAMAYNVRHHGEFEKTLFAASVPMLRHLKKRGLKVGVVTATSRRSFLHDLAHHHVPLELFDYTQTADDTEYHKPDLRVFEPAKQWLAANGMAPNNVLYVGDGLHDMKAATGAGFAFLGVETGLVSAKQFAQNGATSVPDISHLMTD